MVHFTRVTGALVRHQIKTWVCAKRAGWHVNDQGDTATYTSGGEWSTVVALDLLHALLRATRWCCVDDELVRVAG